MTGRRRIAALIAILVVCGAGVAAHGTAPPRRAIGPVHAPEVLCDGAEAVTPRTIDRSRPGAIAVPLKEPGSSVITDRPAAADAAGRGTATSSETETEPETAATPRRRIYAIGLAASLVILLGLMAAVAFGDPRRKR
ncbi:hypothetical protein [Rhodobacter sp. NSM]|uniref:hypothetical protein n=1 Tax=Rhodobacter sp. NSM TaxID=3457501 RepID=UPI003FD3C749